MRGRKPKPTPLKVLHGSQPCRINDDEPQPLPGRPSCPDHLDDEGRAEWDRIIPQLEAMKVLTQADGAALAVYCQVHSRWLKALEAGDGKLTIDTGTGSSKPNPAITIAERCENFLLKWLAEYGLTASSRSKIKASAKPQSELSAFLANQPKRSG